MPTNQFVSLDGNISQQSEPHPRSPRSGPNESNGQQHEYKNEFIFPNVPLPSVETLLNAHNEAVSFGEPSHQYQLTRAGTNLLSLQEVVLPSILDQTNSALKNIQAMAQRNEMDGMSDHEGKDVVEVTEACRKLGKLSIAEAMKIVGESSRQREQSRLERLLAEVEQRRAVERQAKQDRKNERALAQQARYDSAKESAKRQHPCNKARYAELEMWKNKLEELKEEERVWKQVKNALDAKANEPPPEPMELDPPIDRGTSSLVEHVENTPLEDTVMTLRDDATSSISRVNSIFSDVSSSMQDSERLRNAVCVKSGEFE